MEKVDARGLSCPEPIILLSTAIQENDQVEIVIDAKAAFENIKRYAQNNKLKVESNIVDEEYYLVVSK